jgi:hypothetical protein
MGPERPGDGARLTLHTASSLLVDRPLPGLPALRCLGCGHQVPPSMTSSCFKTEITDRSGSGLLGPQTSLLGKWLGQDRLGFP